MQTFHLSAFPAEPKPFSHGAPGKFPSASVIPLYPELLRYQRLENAINRVSDVLDAHRLSALADELCEAFNDLP